MLSRRLFLTLSRNCVSWTSVQKNSSFTKTLVSEFDNYFPKIIDDGIAKATLIESAEMKERMKRVSEYYIVGRKPVQGEFIAYTYDNIVKPKVISDELLHQFKVLFSTVEMVQTYFYFWDDLEDSSETRCGKICWHLVSNTGILALNDASLMRTLIEELIRQNFNGKLREDITTIYGNVYLTGAIGQHLDLQLSKHYEKFTMQYYNEMNRMKSAFYSIKSPLLLGLALGNKFNKESFRIVDSVCDDIGILVQIHNDLIDYFNTLGSVPGKSGTDIQKGKCCWTAVAALEKCNPEQRRIFLNNYGSWDEDKVNRIHQLYEELDLMKLYKQEEQARYDNIHKKLKIYQKILYPLPIFSIVFAITSKTTLRI